MQPGAGGFNVQPGAAGGFGAQPGAFNMQPGAPGAFNVQPGAPNAFNAQPNAFNLQPGAFNQQQQPAPGAFNPYGAAGVGGLGGFGVQAQPGAAFAGAQNWQQQQFQPIRQPMDARTVRQKPLEPAVKEQTQKFGQLINESTRQCQLMESRSADWLKEIEDTLQALSTETKRGRLEQRTLLADLTAAEKRAGELGSSIDGREDPQEFYRKQLEKFEANLKSYQQYAATLESLLDGNIDAAVLKDVVLGERSAFLELSSTAQAIHDKVMTNVELFREQRRLAGEVGDPFAAVGREGLSDAEFFAKYRRDAFAVQPPMNMSYAAPAATPGAFGAAPGAFGAPAGGAFGAAAPAAGGMFGAGAGAGAFGAPAAAPGMFGAAAAAPAPGMFGAAAAPAGGMFGAAGAGGAFGANPAPAFGAAAAPGAFGAAPAAAAGGAFGAGAGAAGGNAFNAFGAAGVAGGLGAGGTGAPPPTPGLAPPGFANAFGGAAGLGAPKKKTTK
eukprot:m.57358 g.57358  ORF g.57358 m.57358 type:complete len:498 (+) comp12105_c0_seq3:1-1494(+)